MISQGDMNAVAVFGTRLVLPVLIVSATAFMSPWEIIRVALFDPAQYAALLQSARYAIDAFGAAFLLLVAMNFFLDDAKTIHWIETIEKRLAKLGELRSLEIAVAMLALLCVSFFVPLAARAETLIAGLIGIELFIIMQTLMSSLSVKGASGSHAGARGLSLFIYLEVLDTAFSFDGVVGAFAISTFIPAIVIGLGVGAYFVRSITVYLVERRTLESLAYLEHGAHWAIFGLSLAMFANLIVPVPEFVTGSIGIILVSAAYVSSTAHLGRNA